MMGTRKNDGDQRRPITLFIPLIVAALLFGCNKGQDAAAPTPQQPAKPAGKAANALPAFPAREEKPGLDLSEIEGLSGKKIRDPFKPFIRIERDTTSKQQKPVAFVPKTPLQRFALEELKFVGVLWSKGVDPQALIEDPGGKGYTVKVGTYLGNRGGKLKEIKQDQILIEEEQIDVLGETNTKLTTIKLHKPENEVNP